ncbi:hypothetical protein [Luteococcus sp. OSA5]|uniref:hypothetical protein n=1 Tax=Luteococcus sp. OSA5 TaxID=3401630 RepID=UPI003B431261
MSTSAKKLIASTALAFALGACSGTPEQAPTTSSSATTEPSSTAGSSTPSPAASQTSSASPSTGATPPANASAADAAVHRYVEVTTRIASDPKSDMDQLQTVARGSALRQWQYDISQFRAQKQHLTGMSTLALVKATAGSEGAFRERWRGFWLCCGAQLSHRSVR